MNIRPSNLLRHAENAAVGAVRLVLRRPSSIVADAEKAIAEAGRMARAAAREVNVQLMDYRIQQVRRQQRLNEVRAIMAKLDAAHADNSEHA